MCTVQCAHRWPVHTISSCGLLWFSDIWFCVEVKLSRLTSCILLPPSTLFRLVVIWTIQLIQHKIQVVKIFRRYYSVLYVGVNLWFMLSRCHYYLNSYSFIQYWIILSPTVHQKRETYQIPALNFIAFHLGNSTVGQQQRQSIFIDSRQSRKSNTAFSERKSELT